MITIVRKIDRKVAFWFTRQYHHKYCNVIMKKISKIGDFGFIWIATIAICAVFPKTHSLAFRLIFALVLATLFGQGIIKSNARRLRPCQRFKEVSLLVKCPSDTSFPSGHTTSSFACATVIYFFYPIAGILAFVFATLIGISRLYLFVHYLSDVLIAIYLGIGVGVLIMIY